MLSHTHDYKDDDGTVLRMSKCTCGTCQNIWYVQCGPEFQANFCPYCGIRFKWYDDGKNNYKMNGEKMGDDEHGH